MTESNVTPFQAQDSDVKNKAGDGDAQRDATAARLKAFVERIERLEEEKAVIAEDIKEVYGEAKGAGFDVKTLRKVVSLRKMDEQKRREEEELLDLYKGAIGL